MRTMKAAAAVVLAYLCSVPGAGFAQSEADDRAAQPQPQTGIGSRTAEALPAATPEDAESETGAVMSGREQASAAARLVAALHSETAEQAVDLATSEVMQFINSAQPYARQEPERFFREVETLMGPLIDFDRFSRNVMGPYFRQATPEQRSEFAQSFKSSLVRTYALALTEFHDGKVTVIPPRAKPRNPDKAKVTQEIEYAGRVYQVVYDVRRTDAAWSLRNMVIEGVNVGLSFKSQFASAMKGAEYNGDLDQVIAAWSRFVAGKNADSASVGKRSGTTGKRSATQS